MPVTRPTLCMDSPTAGPTTLTDPVRIRLVKELAEPASSTELARRLGEPRQRINYHVRELERAGLIRLVEERRRGNCTERFVQAVATSYLVGPEVLAAISADPNLIADRASSAYLIAVAGQTIREVAELRDCAAAAGQKLPTLSLQSGVRFDSPEAMNGFAEELTAMVTRLVAKYHRDVRSAPIGREFKITVSGHPAITRAAPIDTAHTPGGST